jgi:hypothetical protein
VINSVPAPEKFTFIKDDWKSWITHFERYRKATKQDAGTEQSQINSLLLHMGAKVTSFLESQQRNESDFGTYKELKEFFDKSFCVTTNLVYARAKFNLKQQKAGETAQEYISCLISLGKECKYQNLEDELIRDRLVVGIRDTKLSETLQLDCDLSLQKATQELGRGKRNKKKRLV